ncbi:hypothetical protein [Flagellimonas flava]|uniref:Uncharacterized protein n=1 Tax=Flagellimonas flava TaxID=570519 RepID=A0A1M5IDD7_9FLAO|nr:hypothetical protein [Allomuricauda flava]SHG26282.1 hypothetical protein SAMN04488116_0631 [Allomuricauda flava]
MITSDWTLLENVKQKIAEEANLQGSATWTQKDFDFLSYYIEEKAGCRLSVSTLKRIWSNNYQRLPHISTLDALSKTAFEKDWRTLKSDSLVNRAVKKRTEPQKLFRQQKKFRKVTVGWMLAIPIILILIGAATTLQKRPTKTKVIGDVTFGHRKTVENKLPNTVVFTYDIEAIDADSFFLQQSWDSSRKVEIFKGTQERTDIYYIPGYFTAKLMADDEVVKEMPIHVVYEDWFVAARQPMSRIFTFDKTLWSKNGHLRINKDTLEIKGIDVNKEFQLAYYYVKNFEVEGDNLSYTTSFGMQPLENVDCPIINIHLQGTKGYYWIMIGNKGCGSELAVRVGDKLHNGKTSDLTALTTNMYQWNDLQINTDDKNVRIDLNGSEVFSTSYLDSLGDIMELSYFFNGIGMIDNVKLANDEGEIKFHDDFED